jgi:hypothetical protein
VYPPTTARIRVDSSQIIADTFRSFHGKADSVLVVLRFEVSPSQKKGRPAQPPVKRIRRLLRQTTEDGQRLLKAILRLYGLP